MLSTIIIFLLVLSVLVLVHELGHFLVAKKTGILVEEFGFGLPPRILAKKIGETIYSLNLLPIGGFVKLAGEDEVEEETVKNRERMFFAKSRKVRFLVIVAGVFMNFLLAVTVFSLIYLKSGIPAKTDKVRIVGVTADSPAQKAGIKEGDIVISVADKEVKNVDDFSTIAKESAGQELTMEIKRKDGNPCKEKTTGVLTDSKIACRGENLLLKTTPRERPPEGEGPLGVVISQIEMRFYPFWQMIPLGVWYGLKEALLWTWTIASGLMGMFWRLFRFGTIPQDVAGPVGIFQITGEVAKSGVFFVLDFLAILSVNLAIVNILPFPALDGGRLLFLGIEAITGKRSHRRFEHWAHAAGMVFLLFLILLITINDLLRIFSTADVFDSLKSLLPF